ncbi:MAG: sigma-70 family RNA polymerase sigma factor [Planctomycetia bacterium]|nr:sigma-70 family RNA polymerase sigma factor [Planctomycetia bacterium]
MEDEATAIQQLVERVRRADTAALADYVQAKRPQLLGFIEKQLSAALRRKVDPEDLVQEISADAFRALAQVDLAERDPFSWLCQIAERRIIDAHRRYFGAQKRDAGREVQLQGGADSSQSPLVDLLIVSMTSPSSAFSRNQRENLLLAALDKLPGEQRDALRMRYIENLPSKEIAERLNKSDVAVRVMLTRSLKKLQELLGPEAAP